MRIDPGLEALWEHDVGKRGGDARTAGQRAYIGGGTGAKSIYQKKDWGQQRSPQCIYMNKQRVARTKLTAQQKMSTHPLNEVRNKKKQKP